MNTQIGDKADILIQEVIEIDLNGKYVILVSGTTGKTRDEIETILYKWLISDKTFLLLNSDHVKLVKVKDGQST